MLSVTEGANEHVLLNEDRSQACAATEGEDCDPTWFLDTGASNHMSGHRDIFFDLNIGVHDSIKLGDGSVVQMEGRGTVLFESHTGEHLVLSEVCFIPRMQSSIISISQLDKIDYDTRINHGILELQDPDGRMIARASRT